ncbi:acetyl-CoA C-acyltransferase family protein [Alkalilimnicola sp. S0819]|uniref:acetyl-CoA C-acyltransferase family protein n=1 Tax=Alkalilimnicola sp. S0819 TaxID=2613922 RepID=UPI0012629E16|nr:acetyl-CoA C-acyltransferase family protein [Alkalilimnicola sp. S0819]KAB7623354.1 acetyl-CoA C-acyltransferase family protein [Alkalilimnicola sp. S0819]MPQ16893.1 acetyl-CoA C-acyltransferase [Alkalilimnicola sp. S0819]
MNNSREVVVVGAARTAIGAYGGSLKDVPLADLATLAIKEAVSRSGAQAEDIGHTVLGNVIHTEKRDMYISRLASVNAGLPHSTPALTLNRLCGSGLQAIVTAAQQIELGQADMAVGGGAEAMSRAPFWLPTTRWGQRMGDGQILDAMVGALTDPFESCHMGITAENIAEKWKISREDQDAFAAEAQRRGVKAVQDGVFKDQIVPVEIKTRKGVNVFDTDENPREVSTEKLAGMRPVFKKDGSVTAGNASSINDGAAAVVLAERGVAEAKGLKPLARLVGYSVAGVDPQYMGIGPVPAIKQLLADTGVAKEDIDLWELNEAFASQALAVVRDLELDEAKVNPNGSGISLGHPIGATGAILTVKSVYELQRTGGRYAVVSMCIGGGQGIAALFERL